MSPTKKISFFAISKAVFKNLTLSVIKKESDNLWEYYIILNQFFNKNKKCFDWNERAETACNDPRSYWTYLFLEVEETKAKMLVLRHAYPY
jgi:hypothetical protein